MSFDDCPTPTKIRYESDVQALAYARLFNLTRSKVNAKKTYWCDPDADPAGCGYWHLTKGRRRNKKGKPGSERRRRRQRRLLLDVWEGEGGSYV